MPRITPTFLISLLQIFVRAFDLDERLVGVAFLDVGVYVTTMRATLSEAQLSEEPLAGSLLALRPGVKGMAETPFAG